MALLSLGVNRRHRKLSTMHYWMISLVGLSMVSLLWTIDWDSTATRIGTYAQLLVVVWLIWELAVVESRILGLMQAYVLGISFASALTIYNFSTGTTAAQLQAARGVEKWEETRYSIMGVNENDLGLMLAMCIPIMIYLVIRTRGSLIRLFLWGQLVTCIVAILLTGSRGSLISAAIALLMLPLTIGYLTGRHKLAAVLACAGVVVCGVFFIPAGIWARLLGLSTELTKGTLTHRTLIWSAGLAAFRDHPFLGVGSGAFPAAVLRIVDISYVAHNTFLSVLVELGVVGALLLIGLVFSMFYAAFRMLYLERCLWVTVLLSWTVGVMALTWEYRKPTWVMFALLSAHVYARRKRHFEIEFS